MRIYLKDIKKRYPELEIINYKQDIYFENFNHDSRVIVNNALFIPIVGEKFDGHDFVKESFKKGSKLSLFQRDRVGKYKDIKQPLIVVDDIQQGLEKVVRMFREKITSPVIAITGSTGKTTTREMIASILSQKGSVLKSDKNINTLWGNAQILSQYENHDYIILELGMDRKGEIKSQCRGLDPDLGILLNVGYVHAMQLGGIQNVYLEKKELANYLISNNRFVCINIDDPRLVKVLDSGKHIVTFGSNNTAEYVIKDTIIDEKGTHFKVMYKEKTYKVDLKIYGKGYAYNATASIALCNALGISIRDSINGLNMFNGFNGRFEIINKGNGTIFVNDAYNANPTSMEMSLETFSLIWDKKNIRKILVLGDMKELGDVTNIKHQELGRYVSGMKVDAIYYIGENFYNFNVGIYCRDLEVLYEYIKKEISDNPKSVILFKASNSIGLESVIERF